MQIQTCKKCKKPITSDSLCENCLREIEKNKSLMIKATKLLNTLTHGEFHNYIVNQTQSFDIEFFHDFLWAPVSHNGRCHHSWKILQELKVGDIVFNTKHGLIEGISTVIKEAVIIDEGHPLLPISKKTIPTKYLEKGYYVKCESIRLKKPLDLNFYMEERKKMSTIKNSPFDQDGEFLRGYLFPLTDEFAEMCKNEIDKYCR